MDSRLVWLYLIVFLWIAFLGVTGSIRDRKERKARELKIRKMIRADWENRR